MVGPLSLHVAIRLFEHCDPHIKGLGVVYTARLRCLLSTKSFRDFVFLWLTLAISLLLPGQKATLWETLIPLTGDNVVARAQLHVLDDSIDDVWHENEIS